MNQRVLKPPGWTIYFDRRMRAVFLKLPSPSSDQPQLGIWIKPAVFDPFSEKKILARNPEADHVVSAS